ncbi:dihydrofolate reductase [Sinorhizobium meliloti]|nr:dihydrofolate reductase [Sinorhizobium meliloti]
MRKVIMWDMVSVDGFFEAPGHDIGWFVSKTNSTPISARRSSRPARCFFGRTTYELMAAYWPSSEDHIAAFMNGRREIRLLQDAQKCRLEQHDLVSGEAADEVRRPERTRGRRNLHLRQADFASTLIAQGLVDEYRSRINPVLLGKGTPLFKLAERTKLAYSCPPLKSGVVILITGRNRRDRRRRRLWRTVFPSMRRRRSPCSGS